MLIAMWAGKKVAINVLRLSPDRKTNNDSDTSCGKHSNQLIHAPGIGAGHTRVGPAASALQRIPTVYNPLAGDGEVPQSVVLLFDARVGHRGHP